ncbi:hypothetical protein HWV62_38673 [Athelia sp. TMB]|nr:hypothetical protein HWV62_38673 [Athelia sp. TMB]
MHASSSTLATSASASFPTILPDNSQKALERVISSRLVETFVSITVDISPPEGMPGEVPPDSSMATTPSTSQLNFPSIVASPERGKLSKEHRKSSSSSSLVRKVAQTPTQQVTTGKNLRRDSARLTQLAVVTDPAPKTNGVIHASSWSRSSPIKSCNAASTSQPLTQSPSVPDYISPIHRPSTNPFFAIDAKPGSELASQANLSGQRVHVECWGKVGSDWSSAEEIQRGKGKSKITSEELESKENWKVLEEWNVNLADLMPLPDHLSSNPSQLPSNTLLITLSPQGYNSDPESLSRKGRITSSSREATERQVAGQFATGLRRNGTAARESQFVSKTAGWQDLLKLATLQTCIVDTEESLSDIIGSIDATLHRDIVAVLQESDEFRNRIATRKELLRARRNNLFEARELLQEDLARQHEVEAEIAYERAQLTSLRKGLSPARTVLIATLAAIFPIELLSPPDLLYTILSVPLPIPLSSTDPAPPLSLPGHKEVTEDAVATALGFAAQVVQLLAAYLSKSLVYPITCVGSRSLIRDGISAMVGPRMFPLFSKGVDTYRFEYGVFLLNKDIEMLMADRDLRALDMRHTLPNLKNLLLTLSDGEDTRLRTPRIVVSPTNSASGLESPRAKSPPPLDLTASINTESEEQIKTPISSGATTPTATASPDDRKTRSLLGFYPLAGFLRSRYPSVTGRPSVKSVSETHEGPEVPSLDAPADIPADHSRDGVTGDDDDDDRRTLRGASDEREPEREVKRIADPNGLENAGHPGSREKSHNADPHSNLPIVVSDMG